MEPMKPRSTRYFRLLLGPRKPSLEEERYEDDGRMHDRDVKDGWLDGWRRGSRAAELSLGVRDEKVKENQDTAVRGVR